MNNIIDLIPSIRAKQAAQRDFSSLPHNYKVIYKLEYSPLTRRYIDKRKERLLAKELLKELEKRE